MSEITVVRINGVRIYLDDSDELEHVCIGSGETDTEALNDAIHDLEEALQKLRNMQ
jgi:hypothetical protein